MSRNEMYDALETARAANASADFALVAVGLGAAQAYYIGDVLQVIMQDGSGFAFL